MGAVAHPQIAHVPSGGGVSRAKALEEPALVRRILITLALAFLVLFLGLPLAAVFVNAFSSGLG
ncbi:MAG TPA: hypothetical protein DEP35_17260, partial [Deltaproteobacteria bacterium]|nr:hypothetical protein [Deltaproteobacteria bacterium]